MRPFALGFTAIAAMTIASAAHAQTPALDRLRIAPAGFREIQHEQGVTLWKKNNEYVQIISPHRGAVVTLLHGGVLPTEGEGTIFGRKNLQQWWKEWSAEEGGALTLANGQFFNMNDPAKSPLAFSTKIDGIVYAGYGDVNEYGGKKMALRIGNRTATVEPYNDDAGSLYDYPEEDIIVGLRPDVSKACGRRLGRTFIGTMRNGNVAIFTSPLSTQRHAERMLMSFGADRQRIMMLDGGGSTQFIVEGELMIPSKKRGTAPALRAVPLAIGVTKGDR